MFADDSIAGGNLDKASGVCEAELVPVEYSQNCTGRVCNLNSTFGVRARARFSLAFRNPMWSVRALCRSGRGSARTWQRGLNTRSAYSCSVKSAGQSGKSST